MAAPLYYSFDCGLCDFLKTITLIGPISNWALTEIQSTLLLNI